MTCPEVARLLGDAPRSVENWVHRFDQRGLAGLTEGERCGRPSRLKGKQVKEINRVLREKPSDAGMRVNLWDGKVVPNEGVSSKTGGPGAGDGEHRML